MKSKFFALLAFAALFLNVVGAASAQTKTSVQTNSLTALLPASDGVIALDVQRLLNEAAPQILSGKPQMLAEINRKIDEMRDKTGLDARQFEQIAIGVAMKPVSAREIDLEPVFLARGKYNANALIAVAKLASKGKYREEKIGSRAVYIFSKKEILPDNKTPTNKTSVLLPGLGAVGSLDFMRMLPEEIAVTSLDGNTLAFGTIGRVRETVENKSRASSEILGLINRKPSAVVSFGANLPSGLSGFINLDNDELGRTLDSIRQMFGAIDVADGNTSISVAAKTLKPEQAQTLKETLDGLQMLGKALIGGGKGEDKKVYARMIDNARIAHSGSEVSLDLQVPQSDIDILISGIK